MPPFSLFFARAAALGALAAMAATLTGCGDDKDGGHTTITTTAAPCLCVFDVDRTLTARQRCESQDPSACSTASGGRYCEVVSGQCKPKGGKDFCNNTNITEHMGVPDTAYDGGILRTSELGSKMNETFCNTCMHGIVSAGEVSGPDPHMHEREIIFEAIGGIKKTISGGWMDTPEKWNNITSPLVIGYPDTKKQDAVASIVEWYRNNKYHIADGDVYFFDDRLDNVQPFSSMKFNAMQVSCKSRDANLGLCGATLDEIQPKKGVHPCPSATVAQPPPETDKVVV